MEAEFVDCIIHHGINLLGTPYQSGTLEGNGAEILRYSDSSFDCVTYVEYVLSKALCDINKIDTGFVLVLKNLRYRDGVINGYGSRIHYFTEWILQNSQRGLVKDITAEIGGLPYKKNINYMSTNKSKYPQLTDKHNFAMVTNAEKRINNHKYYYVPKQKINNVQHKILSGDIIAFTTTTAGLDIAHTGFAFWQGGVLHLLHASEKEGKVVFSKRSLSHFAMQNKKFTGIMVVRYTKLSDR